MAEASLIQPPAGERPLVREAVFQVAKTFLGSERVVFGDKPSHGATCRVVSYSADFAYLWGVGDHREGQGFLDNAGELKQMGDLVLVWDGVPARETQSVVDTAGYLTAFDWVVGSSLEIAKRLAGAEFDCPNLRIYVLDVLPPRFRTSPAVRFFDQFPNRIVGSFPWLRVFSIATTADGLGFGHFLANLLLPRGGCAAPDWQAQSMRDCFAIRHRNTDLQTVGRFWAAGITESSGDGNRHALANVVGPMILTGCSSSDLHDQALLRLLQQVDLLPAESAQVIAQTWVDWRQPEWANRITRLLSFDRRPLNVLLVDDCAIRHGWGNLLCNALGADYDTSIAFACRQARGSPLRIGSVCQDDLDLRVYATEDARTWLTELGLMNATPEGLMAAGYGRGSLLRLEDETPGQSPMNRPPVDVLFLDLRLLQDCSLMEEAEFYLGLIPAARLLLVQTTAYQWFRPPLRWPGFSTQELNCLSDWLTAAKDGKPGASRGDSEYIHALTLVPRILAILEPFLPIVLFSSTGRRQVIELLKPYGSILTDWAKPQLGSTAVSPLVDDTALRFQSVMAVALERAAASRLCRRLMQAPVGTMRSPEGARLTAELNSTDLDQPWLIELLLDESEKLGKKKDEDLLTVGGLVLVYPPATRPGALEQHLSAQCVDVRRGGGKAYTRKNREAITTELIQFCEANKVFAAAMAVTGTRAKGVHTDVDEGDELLDERVGDNLWQELFHRITELTVFHVARHQVPSGSSVELIVRAGERQIPIGVSKAMERAVAGVHKYWGMNAEYTGYDARLWRATDELAGIAHAGEFRKPLDAVRQDAQNAIAMLTAGGAIQPAAQPIADKLVQLLLGLVQDLDARTAALDTAKEFLRHTKEVRSSRHEDLHASIRELADTLATGAVTWPVALAPVIPLLQTLVGRLPTSRDLAGSGFGLPARCLRYVRQDSLRMLVAAIMREYAKGSFCPQTILARAYPLNKHGGRAGKDVSIAHFLADAIIHPLPQTGEPNLSRLYEYGLQVQHGHELVNALRAQRSLLMGNRAEAIARAAPMIVHSDQPALAHSMAVDLAEAARRLDGPEFLSLARRLLEATTKLDPLRRRSGTVEKQLDAGVRIREHHRGRLFWGPRHECKGRFDNFRPGGCVTFSGRRGGTPDALEAVEIYVSS